MPLICQLLSRILPFVIFFLPLSDVNAQSMRISAVTVEEGDSTVEVPVLITFSDSALALQLSIVWPENELILDSLLFSEELLSQNILASYNSPRGGDLRVIIQPAVGHLDPIRLLKDLVGFTIFFSLTDQYSGDVIIDFNPDFPNLFANSSSHIFPTLTNGSISNADGSVSTTELGNSSGLTLYPNPVKDRCTISGLPAIMANANFRLIDPLGRIVWSEALSENSFVLPESISRGTYWILIDGGGKTYVKALVVSR